MSERIHELLKTFLIDLGKSVKDSRNNPYYDNVYSGDSEPVDIRLGKRHLEDKPDVGWERRGKPFLIEITMTQEWRTIVGQITLASMVKNIGGIFILTSGWTTDYINTVVSLICGKLGVTQWFMLNLSKEDMEDIDKAKKTIISYLRKYNWVF